MNSVPVDSLVGETVVRVMEVADGDGDVVALQLDLISQGSYVLTDWTDWTLRVDRRPDRELPEYFWPPEDHSRRVLQEDSQGSCITSVETRQDEMGEIIGAVIRMAEFGSYSVISRGGGFVWSRLG